ncbi:hypothetical protein HMPREF0381_1622 [Lachnoanaerobaculum saburreum DSM 3986]|uniref:Uncharacterized protein n=1 Tax=Lachnoanaerobaculum saburreum DSM 3986 TaxID=887325 RepID=E6LNT7_9FIRM|nr:hypothetical protein HMPREF0381_1622 [Lachnoanaerobaculum saburreum DSM 3986]
MFPFLIGKVLTKIKEKNKENGEEFPFLIGKVLTKECEKDGEPVTMEEFPFLIGKVLTQKAKAVAFTFLLVIVSIPYR